MAPCSLVEMFCVFGERYCLHEGDVTFQKTTFFVNFVVRAVSLMETPLHSLSLVHCRWGQKVFCFDCCAVDILIVAQFVFWLLGDLCLNCGAVSVFDFGAVDVLIVGHLMFWLLGSWCFDCGEVDVLIVGQLVFSLWGSRCFDCGEVGVLIVGQVVFWLWNSWCFDCGAAGVLIVGQ